MIEDNRLVQWADGRDSAKLGPHGRAFIRVCELFVYQGSTPPQPRSHIPGLEPGSEVTFELQAIVNGRRQKTTYRFKASWAEGEPYAAVSDA
jgi:hypothetical protein